jgi:hypothetical protein
MEARFDSFLDSTNHDTKYEHSLCQTYHRLANPFGALDGTPRWHVSCRSCFGPFGKGVCVGAR